MQPTPKISYTVIVGQLLQKHREARGLHQMQVASSAGISQSTYSRIEQGLSSITVEQLRLIAVAFNLNPVDILVQAENTVSVLQSQGVVVTHAEVEKTEMLIALGFLAAALVAVAAIGSSN